MSGDTGARGNTISGQRWGNADVRDAGVQKYGSLGRSGLGNHVAGYTGRFNTEGVACDKKKEL